MTDVRTCRVFRLPTASPDDVSGVLRLLTSGEVRASEIRAILGKTEGNGLVNDFTRAFAVSTLQAALAGPLRCAPAEVAERVAIVMSGGTEGGLSPHLLVFAAGPTIAQPVKSLAIGTAFTRRFRPEEIGRLPQIETTAEGVARAMSAAGIGDAADVHYVQVKCPLLTSESVADAAGRGQIVVTDSTVKSMGYSRGASALGVGLALGEVARGDITNDAVCRRFDLWSGRASTSAGVELMHNEIVVLGNGEQWASDLVIGHRVMRDAIDLPAALGALHDVGLAAAAGQLDDAARERVVAVLAKADPSSSGRIRGLRHIMLDDSDVSATRHARALVGGVLAGLIGRTDLFVSGGAEHQGPDGGGPVAVIARR